MGNNAGSKPAPIFGTDYDPAGYLPPGLYDTTQIWTAQGTTAKNCNNPLFMRWFPDWLYRGIGDPPFDPKAYPCAWTRNLPYNAWFVSSKWVSPADGTPKWEARRPTDETWGNPWAPYPHGENYFCVLDEKDGISSGSESVPAGNWGTVYPNCFKVAPPSVGDDRLFMEAVNEAQHQFTSGHMDNVTEINRVDPFIRDPCGGRSTLAMLLPWAIAVVAGVGTSIGLRYVVFDDVPKISMTALSVGAAGFGWNFGQAIQAKSRDRDYYVSWASTFLGSGIGVSGSVLAGYAVLPDFESYEIALIAAGVAGGYFYIAPRIEPGIGTGGGLLGSTLGFLGTIIGGIENFFCGIANWDIDGCSPEKNETARSWDRVLLAAAAADSLGKSYGLDPKEKEVAFQAMLVNAANINAYENPTEKWERYMQFDVARSWVQGAAPPVTDDGKPTNSFANLGHVVQSMKLPLEETQAQANVQHFFNGQDRHNKYMQSMFEPTEGALLQKCDRFSEIEEVPQFKNWMDKAYQAAQKGLLAPTRIDTSIPTWNCGKLLGIFLQFTAWQSALAYVQQWVREMRPPNDFAYFCKKTDPNAYYVLHAFGSVKDKITEAGVFTAELDAYIRHEMAAADRTPDFYSALITVLERWNFSSQIANDPTASNTWRAWKHFADGGVETQCSAELAAIEAGDKNWKVVGEKAMKFSGDPQSCTKQQRGQWETYRQFGYETVQGCKDAVRGVQGKVQSDLQLQCGAGTAFSKVTGLVCTGATQDQIDEWVAACSQ